MSDHHVASAALAAAGSAGQKKWWQWILLYPAFIGALIGAVPTGVNAYKSVKYDVGFSDVNHAEEQRSLWIKNFKCTQSMKYQQLTASDGSLVQIGACENGDILIEVQPPNESALVEWISIDRLKKAATVSLAPFISPAYAALSDHPAERNERSDTTRLADVKDVKCQVLNGQKITRVVDEGGMCFREQIDVLKGTVLAREEVPCSTTCE